MTSLEQRKTIICDIKKAVSDGARCAKACSIIGLSARTLGRWQKNEDGDKRPSAVKHSPSALTDEEKQKIIDVCTSDEYKDMSPNVIIPILAEKGVYIGSESTFYRVLREHRLLAHRSESKAPAPRKSPPRLVATGPDQIYSWDITYLPTLVKGRFFYLYLFMDIWSRKITGWTVELNEDGARAATLMREICGNKQNQNITLHSDNGAPMKCATMLATLQWLGVAPSFSRPQVSNDNPFSESLFKTIKYCPAYPKEFSSIEEAREWVATFVHAYNTQHRHSGIKYVTPEQRHNKEDVDILERRTATYRLAKEAHPERWSGKTRNWNHIKEVGINQKTEQAEGKKIA